MVPVAGQEQAVAPEGLLAAARQSPGHLGDRGVAPVVVPDRPPLAVQAVQVVESVAHRRVGHRDPDRGRSAPTAHAAVDHGPEVALHPDGFPTPQGILESRKP